MKNAQIAILFFYLVGLHCVYGQSYAGKANIKTSLFPTLPYAFTNDYFLSVQYERAFNAHPRCTYTLQFFYSNYYHDIYDNSQQVSASQVLSWTIKLGPRYYFRKATRKDYAYRGFFMGIAPLYSQQFLWDGLEERHNVGLDAMIGYQRTIKRFTIEINGSWGYSRSWYKFNVSPSAIPLKREGVKYIDQMWTQINIGYLF